MYDAKSEPKEFVADSRADAVAKACGFFQLAEAELTIAELADDQVAGNAGRTVVVALPAGAASRPRREPEGGGRDREPRARNDRSRERGSERGNRGGRGREDGGRPNEQRDAAPQERSVESAQPTDSAPSEARGASTEPSVGTVQGELTDAGNFVLGSVERMGLGPFEISESEEDELRIVQLRGPAAERLSSGDGRTADAIQLLVNQAALRTGERAQRIVVDSEGNPEQREELLQRAADRAARRAQASGRSVALDAMSPKDRRLIHVALRDMDGIATMSIGSGRYRQVVVVPEGAQEYEEARNYEASSRSDG